MPLPEKNNQIITIDEATNYTSAYRKQSSPDAIRGGLFWKEFVQKLLDQPGCAAMRYYHGMNADGKPVIVLVGVNNKGDDMTDGILLELSPLCPPICGSFNMLNS